MILLDCGNSLLKAQYWHGDLLQTSYACSYHPRWSDHFSHWLQNKPAEHCYLASVLDASRQPELEQILVKRFDSAITRFTSQAQASGVTNGYQQPEQLGVDRWLALIAAAERVSGDCIVIDAGSAITLDLLRSDGLHLGGAILPGINTSLDKFKHIFSDIDFSDAAISETRDPGCSTAAAIHINYTQSSFEVLSELVNRWILLLETKATILLAGGDAQQVQRKLTLPSEIVPDLVFRGMHRLATS